MMGPHGFGIESRVALMIAKVGESCRGAVGLLLIPDAHVANVCAGHKQEFGADGLTPVGRAPQFVDGREREARWNFAAAVGASRVAEDGQVRNARKGLTVMLRRAVKPQQCRCVAGCLPVCAGGVSPDAC